MRKVQRNCYEIYEYRSISRRGVLLALVAGLASAQTQVELRTQGRNVDFSGAPSTKPFQIGIVLPGTCSQGQAFFKTNATPGSNYYACTSVNTWTLQSANAYSTYLTLAAEGTVINSRRLVAGAGIGPFVDSGPSGTLTVPVDTSYLNTLYAQLAAANIFTSKILFNGLTGTTPGRRLVCGSLPSGALVAGDEMCSAGGIYSYSDGVALQTPVRFSGGSNSQGTAPPSGRCAEWGASFTLAAAASNAPCGADKPVPFSALVACAPGTEGTRSAVTDSTTATWGGTVTGGGANHILAYCDGGTWTVIGK